MLKTDSVTGDFDSELSNLLIDEEVENIKIENKETKKDLQTLKIKISDLKQMWKSHVQVSSSLSTLSLTSHHSLSEDCSPDRPPELHCDQRTQEITELPDGGVSRGGQQAGGGADQLQAE